ncbi:MAG: Na+-dependent transporter [Myxococcaceae bacterium]|nr:Na+-dependent transporter [Myxococcaceae bacterium]
MPGPDEPRATKHSALRRLLERVVATMQSNLLWVLLAIYLLAGVLPGPGLFIKRVQVGSLGLFGEAPVALSLTNLLLASMLFTAGLGVSLHDARGIFEHPRLLAAGVLANAAMPVLFLALLSVVAGAWPETDEAQSTLAGLALIGAMPIAGGASIWTQNADGNVPLTVGLVLGSTLLSPLSIPLALYSVSHFTSGDYAEDLAEIAGDGTITFSLLSVVVPCFLGIALRHYAGSARVARATPWIKVSNLLVLLTLSYTNASGAMHAIVAEPDYDMLALVFLITATMCMTSFYVGYRLSRLLGARPADTISLTFGVGMNNSSASSVLAAARMSDHPLVLVPILAYGMLQKVLAGSVARVFEGRTRPRPSTG